MPATINGIGTHYYGKNKVQKQHGVCEHCRSAGELMSYDTRLWFVVFYIPVIPLGRKRVLNQCPACLRHRVVPLAAWEEDKQQRLTEAIAATKAKPDDPAAMMGLHATLLSCGQTAEADKCVALLQQRFPQHAPTFAYLGAAHDHQGRRAEAVAFYRTALHLDPSLPEARIAVALDLIEQGKPQEAGVLLKFLEAPGAPPAPAPLFALAVAYQKAGAHPEANALFGLLAQRYPELAQEKPFRQAVQQSAKAVGAKTALPPRRLNRKRLIGWAAAGTAVLALALGSNGYVASHRTLHIVNGLEGRITVEVPGVGATPVGPRGRQTLVLAEGSYRARVAGSVAEQVAFTIRGDFWGRWFDHPAYVLNPGGAALLVTEYAVYSAKPSGEAGDFQLHYGESFMSFSGVDYAFEPFPEKIRLDSHASSARKLRLDVVSAPVENVIYSLVENSRYAQAMPLAEWHLRRQPAAVGVLNAYGGLARLTHREREALAFLAAGAKRRPVEVQWHRHYQDLRLARHEDAALEAEYENLLRAEPGNSVLLYLRGRVATNALEAEALFQRALTFDSANAYAHNALAYHRLCAGDWTGARPHLARACELKPEDPQFAEAFFHVRLALREYDGLEADLRAELAKKPLDLRVCWLCDVLLARSQTEAARQLCEDYARRATAQYRAAATLLANTVRAHYLYGAADFPALKEFAEKDSTPAAPARRLQALVELGQLADAEPLARAQVEKSPDPFLCLALAVAWHARGEAQKADSWRGKALELLSAGRREQSAAAKLLQQDQAPALAELLALSLNARHKALLLLALAQRFPQAGAEFLATARQLNVEREFPFHLIGRLTVR